MRPATCYYMAQAWPPQGRSEAPPALHRAAGQGRRALSARRGHPGRELSAVARRVLAALSGTSQAA